VTQFCELFSEVKSYFNLCTYVLHTFQERIVLKHTYIQSIVCAKVDSQCLEYLGYITLEIHTLKIRVSIS
jgi:hypothetical protein